MALLMQLLKHCCHESRSQTFRAKKKSAEHWGVVAELYKLNVYSAPSDKFKPHVDTPKGFTQFGSLVIYLPNQHKGGRMRVAHKGVERFFDLGSKSEDSSTIQWASFYGDCEHEVLPVTSGHRITLTYQLYVSEHLGGIVNSRFPAADLRMYPLYASVKEMLESPAFMKSGEILGFHCAHQYAHTDGIANQRLPHALKGIDVALFTIFRALGLTVHVRPVLEEEFSEEDIHPRGIITRAASEFRDLIVIGEENAGDREEHEIAHYWGSYDIFQRMKWLNEQASKEVAIPFSSGLE